MRTYNHIKIFIILSAALIYGCTLEDATVFESGDPCNAEYIVTNDGECIKDECPEYDSYLSKGLCPKDYAKCYVDDGGVFYCADQCPANAHDYEYEDGGEKRLVCELDSYEHCGAHDLNCLTQEGNGGWYIAKCDENKKCRVIDCKDGYTLDHDTCLNSKQCCGTDCKDCTRINMMCSKGECVANCPNDSDIRCDGNCLDPMTSKTYCGSDSDCIPHECSPDQECRAGECNCPNQEELCGDRCIDVSSAIDHCGNCDTDCRTADGWLDGHCESGNCQAEACLEGYHFHKEKSADGTTEIVSCMADSLVSCGNDEIDCTSLPGWKGGECRNAVCVPNACSEGFFLFEDKCEANNDTQCGSKDNLCDAETEECRTATAECVCKEGLTRCNGICVDLKSNPDYCGSCDTKCAVDHAQNRCENGACKFTCDEEYTDCDGICYHLSDDVLHCGTCTNQCTTDVANAGPKCTAGSCDFECNQGYDRCSNGCTDILTDTNHCGACDHKCDVANAQNSCSGGSCTFQCNSGFVPNTAQTGCEAYVCTANTTRCNGLTFQTCETNKWGKDIPCTTTISNASATCNDNTGCGYKCNGSSTYCAGSNACKDLSTDADNCGKCDAKCNIANAHDIGCSGGKCTFTCNDRYVKNSAGTGCELYVCTHGAKQCSGLNYQTCDHNKWVTSVTCNVPSNGTAGCNDSTGCYKLCNGGYILCGDNCAGASGKTGIVNKSATIYTNAGSGNIGSLGYLALYAVYGQYNGFYALNISGQKRYISTGDMYILPAKGKVDTSDDHGINVRTGPGTGYGKVGDGIAENDIVTIDGYTSDNKPSGCSYGWFHITSPLKGYAAADYVVLQSGAGGPSTSCP